MGNAQHSSEMIAIVDDDESVRNAIHGVLSSEGLTPRTFASAEEFLASGQQNETACMILDIKMPGMSGLELQKHLAESGSSIPVIFITASEDPKLRTQALLNGAVAFLNKPFDNEVLIASARAALDT